jgi:hypothetical protein
MCYVGVASNVIKPVLLPNFVEVLRLVHKLNCGTQRDTQHDNPMINFYFLKLIKLANETDILQIWKES